MKVNFAYYASWATTRKCTPVYPKDLDTTGYTHLAFAFALLDSTYKLVPAVPSDLVLYKQFTDLKLKNPSLKCILAVGGWAFNDPPTQHYFSNMVATAASRATFIDSVMVLLEAYSFDGIDIDWEYPTAPDRGGSDADKVNFVTLMTELRARCNALGRSYILTMTLPLSNWYLRGFDIQKLEPTVDFFNLMSYDIHGVWDANIPSLGPYVNAHTNMTEIQFGLNMFWKNGIPSTKLVLGLGAYGRGFKLKNPSCTTAGCEFISGSDPGPCTETLGVLAAFEIDQLMTQQGINPIYDQVSGTMYFVDKQNDWISFDSPLTLDVKKKYATDNCLRGVMLWSIDMVSKNGNLPVVPFLASPRDYDSASNRIFSNSGDRSDTDTYVNIPISQCAQACNSAVGCVGYEIDRSSSQGCRLKWVMVNKGESNNHDTYYLRNTRVYYPILGIDFPGNDIAFADIPFHQCTQQCDNTPNCVAFVLKLDADKGCYLKSSLGDPSSSTVRDVYYHPPDPSDPDLSIPVDIPNPNKPDFCWLWTQGRGVGTIPADCPIGQEPAALGCFTKCQTDFRGVGPTCFSDCPPGYSDTGLFCHYNDMLDVIRWTGCDPNSDFPTLHLGRCYHKNVNIFSLSVFPGYSDCPSGYDTFPLTCTGCSGEWYNPFSWHCNTMNRSPRCDSGYDLSCAVGALCACNAQSIGSSCPSGYTWTTAFTCGKNVPPAWVGVTTDALDLPKRSYFRDAHGWVGCSANKEQQWGLCYDKCGPNQSGIGPVCWGYCDPNLGYTGCGLGCALSSEICGRVIGNQVYSFVAAAISIGTLGVGSETTVAMTEAKTAASAATRTAKVVDLSKKVNALTRETKALITKVKTATESGVNSIKAAKKAIENSKFVKNAQVIYEHYKTVKKTYDVTSGIVKLIGMHSDSSSHTEDEILLAAETLSVLDPTGLMGLALSFVYPVCGQDAAFTKETPFSFPSKVIHKVIN